MSAPSPGFTGTAVLDARSGTDPATIDTANMAREEARPTDIPALQGPSPAALAAAAAAATAPPRPEAKRQICFDFTKNQCSRGHTCKFSHDLDLIIEVNSQEKGICFDFLKGTCSRGPLCRFSHDLRNIHIAQAAAAAPMPPVDRPAAPICYDFVKNQCSRGDACRYSHDYASILLGPRPPGKNPYVMCMDYVRGKCTRGAGCRYAHGPVAPHPGMVAHAAASGAGAAAFAVAHAQLAAGPVALAQAQAAAAAAVAVPPPVQVAAAAAAAAVPRGAGLPEDNLAAASLALQMQQLGLVSPAAAASVVGVSTPTYSSTSAAAGPSTVTGVAGVTSPTAGEVSTLTALLIQQQQQQQAAAAAAALRRLPSDLTDRDSSIGSGGSTPLAAAHAQHQFAFNEEPCAVPPPPAQTWAGVPFHHPLLAKVKAADALSSGLGAAGSSGSLGSAGSGPFGGIRSGSGGSGTSARSISGGTDSPTIRAAWGDASGGVSTAASSQPTSLAGSPGGEGLLLPAHRSSGSGAISRLGSSFSDDRPGLEALKSIWSRP